MGEGGARLFVAASQKYRDISEACCMHDWELELFFFGKDLMEFAGELVRILIYIQTFVLSSYPAGSQIR